MKEHIAIVGSTSNVARYLIEKLQDEYKITTIGRRNADIIYDLRNPINTLTLPGDIDVLVCIASVISARTDTEILDLMETNVQGMLKMCIAAKQKKIKKVIYISSVFAEFDDKSNYYGYYSLSKKHAEECMELFCEENNIELCILRPSQIYGDDQTIKNNQPLLYTIINNAKHNKNIFIYGKNDAYRNYIHISDVINVIIGVIKTGLTGKFNVINLENNRLSEIAKVANEVWNGNGEIIFLEEKATILDNMFYDSGEIYQLLNIEKPCCIKEGMRRVKDCQLE